MNGYHTGYTGKGVDPFQYARNENDSLWRLENAAGEVYNSIKYSKGDPSDERTADVDASPSKSFLIENHSEQNIKEYFELAFNKRPEYELYSILEDPYYINNIYEKNAYAAIQKEMKEELLKELKKSEDPRVVGPDKEIFETYIRYSPIRKFPEPE